VTGGNVARAVLSQGNRMNGGVASGRGRLCMLGVEQLFNHAPDDAASETHATVDLIGGRIETRLHTVCHEVDRMTSDRHHPGEPVFPDLAMIGRIGTEVERSGKIEHETRYYLCSIALCALIFACRAGALGGGEPPAVLGVGCNLPRIPRASAPATGRETWRSSRHTMLNLLSRA
jgi:hypothetical protein